MIEKLNRRTKKAIVNALEKLIRKYGIDETRVVVNKYFTQIRERKKADEEIDKRERELEKLRRSLN